MIAIQLHAPRSLKIIEVEDPGDPGPGEVRVDVKRIGICGTDWHSFAGNQPFFEYPRILGHELGVKVAAIGPNTETDLRVGDVCSVEPYLNDPSSPASRLGKTNCCQSLRVLGVHMDGGMCPHLILPAGKLHCSDKLAVDALALVETLCIGAHGCERAELSEQDRVLVVGAGPIGLGAYLFARLQAARVVLADISEARLAFAQSQLGIEQTLRLGQGDDQAAVEEALGGHPSVVMDATGHAGSMEAALDTVGHGGRVVFLGIVQGRLTFSDPDFHRKELTLLASRNAPASTFHRVIAALESHAMDAQAWITHRMDLGDVPTAMPPLEGTDGLLKAMVELS